MRHVKISSGLAVTRLSRKRRLQRCALVISWRGSGKNTMMRKKEVSGEKNSALCSRTKAPACNKPARRASAVRRKKTSHEAPQKSAKSSRADSKQAQVLAMLYRKQGATIATVMKATGWQRHSVRGFLTAAVRKRLGLMLVSEKTGEERVYRIVANDVSSKRKGRSGRKAACLAQHLIARRSRPRSPTCGRSASTSFTPCGA